MALRNEEDVATLRGSWGRAARRHQPRREQLQVAAESGEAGPLQFVNLLSYRSAPLPGGHELAGAGLSGADAYVVTVRLRSTTWCGGVARSSSTTTCCRSSSARPAPWDQIVHAVPGGGYVHRRDPGPGLPGGPCPRDPAWPRRPSWSPGRFSIAPAHESASGTGGAGPSPAEVLAFSSASRPAFARRWLVQRPGAAPRRGRRPSCTVSAPSNGATALTERRACHQSESTSRDRVATAASMRSESGGCSPLRLGRRGRRRARR